LFFVPDSGEMTEATKVFGWEHFTHHSCWEELVQF